MDAQFRVIALISLIAALGCRLEALMAIPGLEGLREYSGDIKPAKSVVSPPATAATSESAKQDPPKQAADLSALTQDAWVAALSPKGQPIALGRHWVHAGLEPIEHLPANKRPSLVEQLHSSDKVASANAAILLARWGTGEPALQLARAVRATEFKLPLRCAAAESLGLVTELVALQQIRALVDELCGFSSEVRSRYVPQLHVALIQALEQQADAVGDPRFRSALQSPSPLVRCEALQAYAMRRGAEPSTGPTKLPDEVFALCEDDDARVRATALHVLAVYHHPQALDSLTHALRDYEFSVRVAAIAGLGELGGDEARKELNKLHEHPTELTRAAAVSALAVLDDADAVSEAAEDKSWLVRQAVADSLARRVQDPRAKKRQAALAEKLLRDPSAQVQQHAVQAVATWPLDRAGPALLAAIEHGGYRTRKTAAEQLALHWPAAASFPVNASGERRAAALAELQRQWQERPASDAAVAATVAAPAVNGVKLSSDQTHQIEHLLLLLGDAHTPSDARRGAVAALRSFGPDLLDVLDHLAADGTPALAPELYRDVLPELSLVFSHLDRLSSPDLPERRAAAAAIVASAGHQQLSPLAVCRLAELMAREQDAVVWQYALTATFKDSRSAAVQMAYEAIGHASPEVRRRACEYLAAHGEPRHVPVLLPVLEDPNSGVVGAAVRALGAVGTLENPRPLVTLLLLPDKQLRLEVAKNLARLRVAEGVAALERLALEADADIRRQTTVVMGELADPVFLPSLMQLVEDRPEIQRAALASLVQVVGRDVARAESGESLTPGEQARRWQRWYREHTPAEEKIPSQATGRKPL